MAPFTTKSQLAASILNQHLPTASSNPDKELHHGYGKMLRWVVTKLGPQHIISTYT